MKDKPALNKCVELLLRNKKIKNSELNDIPKIYRKIEISNNHKLFLELRNELNKNGWIG